MGIIMVTLLSKNEAATCSQVPIDGRAEWLSVAFAGGESVCPDVVEKRRFEFQVRNNKFRLAQLMSHDEQISRIWARLEY